jgi:hypothetical protein
LGDGRPDRVDLFDQFHIVGLSAEIGQVPSDRGNLQSKH